MSESKFSLRKFLHPDGVPRRMISAPSNSAAHEDELAAVETLALAAAAKAVQTANEVEKLRTQIPAIVAEALAAKDLLEKNRLAEEAKIKQEKEAATAVPKDVAVLAAREEANEASRAAHMHLSRQVLGGQDHTLRNIKWIGIGTAGLLGLFTAIAPQVVPDVIHTLRPDATATLIATAIPTRIPTLISTPLPRATPTSIKKLITSTPAKSK